MEPGNLNKKSHKSALLSVFRDRTFKTLLLAVLLISIMGSLRINENVGMYPDEYWARKIGWKACADVVITGDSRALMGVSPEELQKKLNYGRIYNYAFGANWYSIQYLEAVENLLDPESSNKIIIMAISHHALTWRTETLGHFIEMSQISKQDAFVDIHFATAVNFLGPMSFRDAYQGMFPGSKKSRTRKNYLSDGFVAVNKTPGGKKEVKRYRKLYIKHRVSQKVINNVSRFVSKWTNSGIKVYGFLMPSCEEMFKLENKISGFNQDKFVAIFRGAGGVWIETNPTAYYSFDGSHLQDNAALDFSRDLAKSMYDIERKAEK